MRCEASCATRTTFLIEFSAWSISSTFFSKSSKLSYMAFARNAIMFRRQLIEYFIKCREIPGAYNLPD